MVSMRVVKTSMGSTPATSPTANSRARQMDFADPVARLHRSMSALGPATFKLFQIIEELSAS